MQALAGAGAQIGFCGINVTSWLMGLCRQHLANALKYSSAFPVIILSALQRGTDPQSIGMSEAGLFRLW